MEKLNVDLSVLEEILVNFLREEAGKVGFKKVVLGLSGGIDSALVAFLAAKAFGPENVLGIMMPYKTSSKESVEHAKLVIEKTGIRSKLVEITPMVDAYFAMNPDMSSLRKGNKMARERMSIQFGDSASAINAIGDLYKTHVWDLSRHMGVPNELIDKKPSADLWEGQTDEQELGYSYRMADEILYRYVEERKTIDEIVKEGYPQEVVEKIIKRTKIMQYKRVMPVIAKVFSRGIGTGFRYPRDWGV